MLNSVGSLLWQRLHLSKDQLLDGQYNVGLGRACTYAELDIGLTCIIKYFFEKETLGIITSNYGWTHR